MDWFRAVQCSAMRGRLFVAAVCVVSLWSAPAARGGWSPAVTLSPSGDNAFGVRVATGARGDQAVVWSRRIDDSNSTVGLALHRPGTTGFSVDTISDPEAPPEDRRSEITTGQNYDPTV